MCQNVPRPQFSWDPSKTIFKHHSNFRWFDFCHRYSVILPIYTYFFKTLTLISYMSKNIQIRLCYEWILILWNGQCRYKERKDRVNCHDVVTQSPSRVGLSAPVCIFGGDSSHTPIFWLTKFSKTHWVSLNNHMQHIKYWILIINLTGTGVFPLEIKTHKQRTLKRSMTVR